MALITCPECGKEVSDSAIACPNCGFGIAALKDRNIVKIKISICADTSLATAPIVIYNTKTPLLAYAKVIQGEVAKFEIKEDTEIGFNFIGPYERKKKPQLTKVISPGGKYQLFWRGVSEILHMPQFGSCAEVEEFSDAVSGVNPDTIPPKSYISWKF